MKCFSCPRKCGIDRDNNNGFCGEGNKIRIAKIINNFMWEEPPVSKQKGTCAIFFSGCNLRCKFCQNYQISRGGKGELFTVKEFADLLRKIDQSDNESIDLITPTHFTDQIVDAFKIYRPKKKIVYNSSGYELEEQIEKIAEYVDIFLPDFKYSSGDLSQKLSFAKDYFDVASRAVLKMVNLKQNVFKEGLMEQGVIIRHLVLPGEIENTLRVLDFVKENISNPVISVMAQFVPSGEVKDGRKINNLEYKIVLNHIHKLGLTEGYVQGLNSADDKFIPSFFE